MTGRKYATGRAWVFAILFSVATSTTMGGEAPARTSSEAIAQALSAADSTPNAEIDQLQELDEVVVRGERLRDVIIKAEDEFYKLYNQLNKNDKYDVSCPQLNISPDGGSRINSRMCLPGFVADAIADFAVYKISCEPTFANFDTNRDGRVSRMESMVNGDLQFQFDELDLNDDDNLDQHAEFRAFETWALMNLNCFRPPAPDLVLMEGTEKWYTHMLTVTNSDPRLKEMAGKLDGLHQEMTTVQRRYRQVSDAQREAQAGVAPDMSRTGPRSGR
jgi:hypothetical protein